MEVEQLIQPAMGPFLAVTAGYLIIIGAIGWYAARTTKTLSDFFVLGGKGGAVVVGFAYFASQYSMSTFIGVPAVTYTHGFSGLTISVPGAVFSMIIPALLVGRKLMQLSRKHGFLTMSDYLADRYQSRAIRGVHAVLILVFLITLMGAQTVGAGVIVRTFTGLPEWVGVVAMGTVVIFYCMSGGMKGAMMTDVLQGALMLTTAIATFAISLHSGGGMSQIIDTLREKDPALLTHPGPLGAYSWSAYFSMIVMWSFFTIGQPTLFTKFFAMKNYRALFLSVILGSLGMMISATLIEWAGVNAIAIIPGLGKGETDFIVPLLLQKSLSPAVASMLIAGIVSAGMSTIDALLVVATGGVTYDIYHHLIHPEASSERLVTISRVVTVVIGIIGIVFGISKPAGIFALVKFAFGGLGIWVVPVILGMYWRRATTAGAISSMIIGELIYIATALWLRPYIFRFDPLIVSSLFAAVVMVVVSIATKPATAATISRHFDEPRLSAAD